MRVVQPTTTGMPKSSIHAWKTARCSLLAFSQGLWTHCCHKSQSPWLRQLAAIPACDSICVGGDGGDGGDSDSGVVAAAVTVVVELVAGVVAAVEVYICIYIYI